MVEKVGDCSLPDEQRCKRSDGRKWRCRRPAIPGRTLCESHSAQIHYRKQREPVPDHLRVDERQKPSADLHEESRSSENGDGDVNNSPNLPQKRSTRKRNQENSAHDSEETLTDNNLKIRAKLGKRNKKEEKLSVDISEKLDDALRKMNLEKGDLQLDLIRGCLMRQVEKKKEKQLKTTENVVRDLKYGRLEISQSPVSSIQENLASLNNVKVGVPASSPFPRRVFRSKNIEPLPVATIQILPSVKAKVKGATKKKKCHWCRKWGYRNFLKCSTCKKHFFCEDCIQARCHDKISVKKKCAVCCGTCDCRACTKERSKDVKTKELVVHNSKKKFDKTQQLLYMIDMLLPLLEQINQENVIELEVEDKTEEKDNTELQIQPAIDPENQQCCFCKSCIVDVHRHCKNCSYMLCISCCRDFREGELHTGSCDFKHMTAEKRKSLSTILWNWKMNENGSINCPPKNLGGCGNGILEIRCLFDSNWTHDLETSAKEIICNYEFSKSDVFSEKGNEGNDNCLYFSMRDEENLEHFIKSWVKGQPIIIRDVVKNDLDLKWDPVFMFCTFLEARDEEGVNFSHCYQVDYDRKQILMRGKTHPNVQNEILKFKVRISSDIFQKHFASNYDELMDNLPFLEYIDPLNGLLNLASKLPSKSQRVDFGPVMYITYHGPSELIDEDFSTKLCYHAFDVVNVLVHATEIPVSEKKLTRVKKLINKYGLEDDDKKIESQNKIDDFTVSSDLSETNEEVISDDDSSIEVSEDMGSDFDGEKLDVEDTCGAQWDIFKREDVPKLMEYLRNNSVELNQSQSSPQKVIHPVLDESFYLNASHKRKLKEEFDIEPWTFEQHVGEAVFIPAGCPYQIRKFKSCVNMVLEFISPESASECLKLSEEIRQLPMNHKSKEKIVAVKKMVVYCIDSAIEEISKLSHVEISGGSEE